MIGMEAAMLDVVLLALALQASQAPDRPAAAAPDDPPPCAAVRNDSTPADLTSDVQWITTLPVALHTPIEGLRGRRIALRDARVARVDSEGFWIGVNNDECRLYIMPAEGRLIQVRSGELVDLEGEFRLHVEQRNGSITARTPFVYAYTVRKPSGDLIGGLP
jgi:hypothetical protein